jgi:hypothetical protein
MWFWEKAAGGEEMSNIEYPMTNVKVKPIKKSG